MSSATLFRANVPLVNDWYEETFGEILFVGELFVIKPSLPNVLNDVRHKSRPAYKQEIENAQGHLPD